MASSRIIHCFRRPMSSSSPTRTGTTSIPLSTRSCWYLPIEYPIDSHSPILISSCIRHIFVAKDIVKHTFYPDIFSWITERSIDLTPTSVPPWDRTHGSFCVPLSIPPMSAHVSYTLAVWRFLPIRVVKSMQILNLLTLHLFSVFRSIDGWWQLWREVKSIHPWS